MPVRWTLNDTPLAELGLAAPKLSYGNMVADTLEVVHTTAAWDSQPLFSYGAEAVLKRDDEVVFRGKRRLAPRFFGDQIESLSYQFAGPWDWLQRRALTQNTFIWLHPAADVPTPVPQGLVVLGQDDDGSTVSLEQALRVVFEQAVGIGVPIQVGDIIGFDYPVVWDVMTDLSLADALIRLLQTAPDAVVAWDYAVNPPRASVRRRTSLPKVTLPIAAAGQGGLSGVPFASISLQDRPDLRVSSVHLTYRRVDTVDGNGVLSLITDSAGDGSPTDEQALVRTITLAGEAATNLAQDVVVAPLSDHLTTAGTITAASDPDAWHALSAFWAQKIGWLSDPGTTIKAFRACSRRATDPAELLDTSLNQELKSGFLAPWMEDTTLNRRGQDQTYSAEVLVDKTINGVVVEDRAIITAGVMATNCSTRTYSWLDSASYSAAELAPTGVAAHLLAAMSVLPWSGEFEVIDSECDLAIRPGVVANLTGGRVEWAGMDAMVQSVTAELESGTSKIIVGWPTPLGPDDLVDLWRANRVRTTPSPAPKVRVSGRF